MLVQIYSMTSVADAMAIALAGAGLIGVVVTEPGLVPEGIAPALAREIMSAIRPRARGVAMALSDDRDEICALAEAARPDIVHLAAREIEPEDCAWIRARLHPITIMRAIAVLGAEAVSEAEANQECVDYLMLDAGAKGPASESHHWTICRTIVERCAKPIILAGGLTPENVGAAIAAAHPWAVDSFTHTDIPGHRGKKDPARVRSFVAAAMRAFAELGATA